MASIPLNTFRNKTLTPIPTSTTVVYQVPAGVTSIILMAQVANVITNPAGVTFLYTNFSTGTVTTIVNDISVPPNDSLLLLDGRLVLQTYDSISLYSDTVDALHFIASILETANQ